MLSIHTETEKVLKLTNPCRCNACENPCRFGSGSLAAGDLKKIAGHLDISEEELKGKYLEDVVKFNTKTYRPRILREKDRPYGKCIFYDAGKGCAIHEVKPAECRIAMGCKPYGEELIAWFNIRNFLNKKDIESLRQFKIYLDSGGKTLPGAEHSDIFDDATLKKIEGYEDLKDDTDWEEKLGLK